jgi:hypothetical protein
LLTCKKQKGFFAKKNNLKVWNKEKNMKYAYIALFALILWLNGCVSSSVSMTPSKVDKKQIIITATTQPSTSISLKVTSKKEEK